MSSRKKAFFIGEYEGPGFKILADVLRDFVKGPDFERFVQISRTEGALVPGAAMGDLQQIAVCLAWRSYYLSRISHFR